MNYAFVIISTIETQNERSRYPEVGNLSSGLAEDAQIGYSDALPMPFIYLCLAFSVRCIYSKTFPAVLRPKCAAKIHATLHPQRWFMFWLLKLLFTFSIRNAIRSTSSRGRFGGL